jgi:alpha-tubulin suppressor-like RCC1 family protein
MHSNNCDNDFDFFLNNHLKYTDQVGEVYTWGSGEMGQLGHNKKVISKMPKDREGYPYQVRKF